MPAVKDFRLPDLGEGLEEGEIVEWHVEVGETIALNQTLADIETAKAVVAVPSPFAGTVVERIGEVGQALAVGAVFVRIEVADDALGDDPDDAPSQASGATGDPAGARADAAASEVTDSGADDEPKLLVGYGQSASSGRRRRVRADGGHAAGPTSSVTPLAKPPVRKLARDLGVELADIAPGSGPDGIITRADVQAAAAAGPAVLGGGAVTGAGAVGGVGPTGAGSGAVGRDDDGGLFGEVGSGATSLSALGEPIAAASGGEKHVPGFRGHRPGHIEPIRGVRRRIVEKMVQANRDIPHASASRDADLTELWNMRHTLTQQARDDGFDVKVTPFALILRAAVIALRRFPVLNSRVVPPAPDDPDRHDAGQIHLLEHINLGFAVDTDRGVIVPNIKDAHARSTLELAAELADLAGQARDSTIGPGALTGGTFTVNNYGAFGVDYADPILNAPEAGMLGIGAIRERPWVVPGQDGAASRIEIRRVAQFTLVFDHRVCDGGEAGRFLSMVADLCEHPGRLLLYV